MGSEWVWAFKISIYRQQLAPWNEPDRFCIKNGHLILTCSTSHVRFVSFLLFPSVRAENSLADRRPDSWPSE